MRKELDHPVGKNMYHKGCRCTPCRNEHTKTAMVSNRAKMWAGQYVKRHHPGVWDRLVDEAYDYYGMERKPVGAPKKIDSKWGMR
jgi:hypothetical protein